MTLEEHILDELAGRARGLDTAAVKLAMQERVHALTEDTHRALCRLGLSGTVGFVPVGKWKLAHYCSPDLIREQAASDEVTLDATMRR